MSADRPDIALFGPNVDAGIDETAGRLQRRPWPEFTPIRNGIDLSFEFFPPATDAGVTSLDRTVEALAPLGPRFVSVTYGAGGSTQDKTISTIERILDAGVPTAGHLTCVTKTRDEVDAVIEHYRSVGVIHVVALRGDAPEGAADGGRHPDGYADAAELVAGIRRVAGDAMEISVAAYPEVHPMAASPQADLDNLKRKLDAGATQAITQFFFDTDDFLRFFEQARTEGITAPIVPGIMPITHFGKITSFAERCGAGIPDWLRDLFDGLDDAPDVRDQVAATVAAEQCRRLAEHGIRSFHFYTMNKPTLTASVCRMLGVRPEPAAQEGDEAAAASA